MLAEIITIGDEILIGQIVDTNSAWMGQELNKAGIRVKQISSISDDRDHILNALDEAKGRADIILITGGLGPTKDDITKKTLCDYFNCGVVFNEDQFRQIETIFRGFGREVTPINRKQAEVPENCTCIVNRNGTAPGMWFDVDGKIYVSMPGVPYEMKAMMEQSVLPMIRERFKTPVILHRTFLTQGVGESMLAGWIEAWEDALPPHLKLAYLAAAGQVRLRISASGEDKALLEDQIAHEVEKLYMLISEHIYGEGEETLQNIIREMMTASGQTLSVAESCTGGYLAHLLSAVPGASQYFKGGAVTYTNELKVSVLGVEERLINDHGVVSEPVAIAMAERAKIKFDSDYSISVTGIAGPNGGTELLPVGTVWIAVSGPGGTEARMFRLGNNRGRNITMAALNAINYLRKILLREQKR